MAENQKDSVKKSFWQRNLFLLIILTLVIVVGGTYLYQNNILSFSLSSQSTENNEKEEVFNLLQNILPEWKRSKKSKAKK